MNTRQTIPCIECGNGVRTTTLTPLCNPCRFSRPKKKQSVPCSECGKIFASASRGVPKCAACKRIPSGDKQRMRELKAARDYARQPDYGAVEWVIQGHTVKLNAASRRLVVRRLADRLIQTGDNNIHIPPGFLTLAELGARTGVSDNGIFWTLRRLPPATRRLCPECRGYMWVLDADGTVEDHGNGFLEQCAMVGRKWLESSA